MVQKLWTRLKRRIPLLRGMARRARKSRVPEAEYYVLHIAKTGGTTLLALIKKLRKTGRPLPLRKVRHRIRIEDILRHNPSAKIGFIVRDPAERFVSGFNSRLRKGLPDHPRDWTAKEARTFARFKTANDLAEALYSADPVEGRTARAAFQDIAHLRRGYVYYLKSADYLRTIRDRIYFVTDTSRLDRDIHHFLKPAGVSRGRVRAALEHRHGAPHRPSPLSDRAAENLRRFWADEYALYEFVRAEFMEITDNV